MTKRSQSRALYICLIMMLVTGIIFISVAFGVGKRSKPADSVETDETPTVTTASGEETPAITTAPRESETPKATSAPDTTEKDSSPVSLTVDDITFYPPVDGEVIVSCSLTVPVYSHTMNDYRTHMGVDVSAALGDSVRSCADGTVESVYEDPMMGVTVVVSHAEGVKSIYQGLSAELPEGIGEGVPVGAGDVIGAVGDTALIECEEEPHLHLELQVNGEAVDPCEYIEMVNISEVYED